MNTIFHASTYAELLDRINQLGADAKPQWGSMNAAQMLAHCYAFHELAQGKPSVKRDLIGLIGRFIKPVFYNDKPLPRDMSTIPVIAIEDARVFEDEKKRLKQQLEALQVAGQDAFTPQPHPFFGRLTAEEWGKGIYKHLDHHLQQFGV